MPPPHPRSGGGNPRRRETTPLLTSQLSDGSAGGRNLNYNSSSSVANKKKRRKVRSLRKIFARSSDCEDNNDDDRDYQDHLLNASDATRFDVSQLITALPPAQHHGSDDNYYGRTRLPVNARDSHVKARPIGVAVRAKAQPQSQHDPPPRRDHDATAFVDGSYPDDFKNRRSSNPAQSVRSQTSEHSSIRDARGNKAQHPVASNDDNNDASFSAQHRGVMEEKKSDSDEGATTASTEEDVTTTTDASSFFAPRRVMSDDSWGHRREEASQATGGSDYSESENDDDDDEKEDIEEEIAQVAAAQQAATTTTMPLHSASGHCRTLLSRPFGRTSLPAAVGRRWVVEVSSAEWDADEQRWKYRILVQQRRQQQPQAQQNSAPHAQSMTAAFCWRSLADFLWLEQHLRTEYHGALLVPVLSIAVGQQLNNDNGMPVEAEKLRHWLSDTLNGVRGQGELVLLYGETLDLVTESSSMEAFLYKSAGQLDEHDSPERGKNMKKSGTRAKSATSHESIFQQLLFNVPMELCVGPVPGEEDERKVREASRGVNNRMSKATGRPFRNSDMLCSSRALGTAPSLDVYDSFADTTSTAAPSSPSKSIATSMYADILQAERELILNYRKTALSAMDKLSSLVAAEERVGVAWKRFAVSLSNLFAYEKDVENAKIGDHRIKRSHMPYRKVNKATVDDCLRVLARQKTERGLPALTALNAMLSAYVADLSTVEPAIEAYHNALTPAPPRLLETGDDRDDHDWESRFRDIARSTMSDVRKKALETLHGRSDSIGNTETPQSIVVDQHKAQKAQLANERLFFESLTTMCRATPVRVARMAWEFWNIESNQATLLQSAATTLQNKIEIASNDSVAKMVKRHMAQEKEDDNSELDLVTRILNLGNKKTNSGNAISTAGDADNVKNALQPGSADTENASTDLQRTHKSEIAFELARERVGKWNSKLALAIMEAVGIGDPNIRFEEMSRDLRMIRKYAIGLRENLNRCIEGIQHLRAVMSEKSNTENSPAGRVKRSHADYMKECRTTFLAELANLFSCQFIPHDRSRQPVPSISGLANAGVNTNDPLGWMFDSKRCSTRQLSPAVHGRVGDLAFTYLDAKDAQSDWLLTTMTELLTEYYDRVEMVEGFVYMECCALQLEKHCNYERAKALSSFERKTDITTAINVARRKRLGKVVEELQTKLDALGPTVSHSWVKETKEVHLESKNLKAELHGLAMRRLNRAREASTERVVTLLSLWAKEEEETAVKESKLLCEAMAALEKEVGKEAINSIFQRA